MANANNKSITWEAFKSRYPLVESDVLVKVIASGNNYRTVEKSIAALPNKPGKPRYSHTWLCNVNAVSRVYKSVVKAYVKKEVPYSIINRIGLTIKIRCYHGVADPILPSRGQSVDITTRTLVDKDGVEYQYEQNKEGTIPLEIVGLPLVWVPSFTLNEIAKASSSEWDDLEDDDEGTLPLDEDEDYDDDNDAEDAEPQYQITRRGKSKGLTSMEDVTDIAKALKLKHIELV